jgi:hypothetical protein
MHYLTFHRCAHIKWFQEWTASSECGTLMFPWSPLECFEGTTLLSSTYSLLRKRTDFLAFPPTNASK